MTEGPPSMGLRLIAGLLLALLVVEGVREGVAVRETLAEPPATLTTTAAPGPRATTPPRASQDQDAPPAASSARYQKGTPGYMLSGQAGFVPGSFSYLGREFVLAPARPGCATDDYDLF